MKTSREYPYRVVVRRSRRRFVKMRRVRSKYQAKLLKEELEAKYDNTYTIEIEKVL